jgi:hypothetical protein
VAQIAPHNSAQRRIIDDGLHGGASRGLANAPDRHRPSVDAFTSHHVGIFECRACRIKDGVKRLRSGKRVDLGDYASRELQADKDSFFTNGLHDASNVSAGK